VPAAHAPVREDQERRGVLDDERDTDRDALDRLVIHELYGHDPEEPEQREPGKIGALDRQQIAPLERERQREEHEEGEQDAKLGERLGRDAELERALGDDATDRVERGGDDREEIAKGGPAQSASQSRG
jgi:hypothetical protein